MFSEILVFDTMRNVSYLSDQPFFSPHGTRCWICQTNAHTHIHPFNGNFSRTTRVSRYQKGKTNLDFTDTRDSEWQRHQLGHMQVCTSLQTDNHASRQHPTTQLFYRPDALPAAQPTASKHWRNKTTRTIELYETSHYRVMYTRLREAAVCV